MKTHLSQKGLLMNISNVPNLAKKRKHFRVSLSRISPLLLSLTHVSALHKPFPRTYEPL